MSKKNTMKVSSRLSNKRWLIPGVFLVSLLFLLANLFFAYHIRPFNSDDVTWQNALLTWRPFRGQVFYLSPDTWIIKYPFFAIFSHLFSPGRKVLGVEAAILAVINISLFFWAAIYFIRKLGGRINLVVLLPLVWLCSFGINLSQLWLNTNLRNIEIGLSSVLLMLVAKVYDGELKPFKSTLSICSSLVVCVLAGLMIYNDPFFLYFTVVPLVALFVFLFFKNAIDKRLLWLFFGGTFISLLSWKVFAHIGYGAHIYLANQPPQFISYQNLYTQIGTAIQALLKIFSADFTGLLATSHAAIVALLNFLLLAITVGLVIKYFASTRSLEATGRSQKLPFSLWRNFFAFTMVAIFGIYILSGLVGDLGTYRYLILLPFFAVILLPVWISRLGRRNQLIVGAILALSILANMVTNFDSARNVSLAMAPNKANAQNAELIKSLEKHNLHLGFGQYWDGNINSYLSNNKVQILPVICDAGQTVQFNWLVNGNLYNNSTPQKTFIVMDANPPVWPALCNTQAMSQQFGPPAYSFQVNSAYTVLVYNYNISDHVPLTNVYLYHK